ncbi:MAG: hypothetical protein NT118_11535, partial [Lentisphaerae bacterium]|nr:hypothetical protein [Lentisphaerota bacterium]
AEFNQQMLITFYIPESQKAGLYSGNINILDGEKEIAAVPLNVRVLPFKLSSPRTRYNPDKEMVYSIYYWGTPTLMTLPDDSEGKTERNDKQFAAEMKDLAQHGITSPIFIWNNDVFFNSPDKVKKGIAMAREAGLCSKDIYFGWSGNTDPKSPEKLAELTAEVKKAIAQFRTLGITGDVYMYCRDEQRSESELRRQLPAMKAIQSGGAKLLVSCFGGAFDVFGGNLDLCVWYGIPNRDEAAAWHSKQGLIWNYGAPQAGTEDPEIYRRNFGLLLWSMNYDGASDYCYADPFKKDRFIHGWNFVYQTFNGIIRTIYWDGFREAIDDVRYASTLKAVAEGKESQEAVAAMRFLNGINPKKDDPELLRLEIIQHILAMQNNKE